MKRCCIFGAGEYHGEGRPFVKDAFVIAADGGLRYLAAERITPDLAVGDFDSLKKPPEGIPVLRYPKEKDETDMALAVTEALARGCEEIFIFGGMGGRLDHTIANMALLLSLAKKRLPAYLVGDTGVVTALGPDETLIFNADCEGVLSVFSATEAAKGVTLSGFFYPLEGADLHHDTPLGVSNEFIGEEAFVSLEEGLLFLMWEEYGNPLPTRRGRVKGDKG